MDKRSILAIVLSLMVLYIYQVFFVKPQPLKKMESSQQGTAVTDNAVAGKAIDTEVNPAHANSTSLQQSKGFKEKEIPIETAEFSAVFTTRGAALKSFKLKKYRQSIDKKAALVELVNIQPGFPASLTVSFAGSDFNVDENAVYEAKIEKALSNRNAETERLTFTLDYPGVVKVEKIYRFHPGKYHFDLEIQGINLSKNPLNQFTALNWYEYVDPQRKEDQYGHEGPVSLVAKNIERDDVKKMAATKTIGPDVSWSGFESKYFVAAMIPQSPSLTSLSLSMGAQHTVNLSMNAPKSIIPPGQTSILTYSVYLGPKDYSILQALNVGLENAVDFGDWLKWLAMPLLITLKFLYNNVVQNYGIAIIILTTLIKIIFWPLGNKSYKSMKEMQKLQPKMAELREKYKDDKNRLSQEMMALYKAHKVNPMGGCLPMVIQIPVFFGLYKTLLYAIELRHSPLIWWIQDLSAKDPYYITPIIMGGTMFLQQKMTPPAGDPMQAKIMLFMPIIFTVMFLNFPSGLVIYWLFNNIISIGQQYYINKQAS